MKFTRKLKKISRRKKINNYMLFGINKREHYCLSIKLFQIRRELSLLNVLSFIIIFIIDCLYLFICLDSITIFSYNFGAKLVLCVYLIPNCIFIVTWQYMVQRCVDMFNKHVRRKPATRTKYFEKSFKVFLKFIFLRTGIMFFSLLINDVD